MSTVTVCSPFHWSRAQMVTYTIHDSPENNEPNLEEKHRLKLLKRRPGIRSWSNSWMEDCSWMSFFCLTIFNLWSDSIDSTALFGGHVCVGNRSQSSKSPGENAFHWNLLRHLSQTTKAQTERSVAVMSFQNSLQMRTTCQQCSAATLWPPCPSAASLCARTLTDTYFNLIPITAYRKTLGDWHPPPHLPLYTPFSSSPSTPTDPLSGGPLFTFTLLHGPAGLGGRAESLHYCLVLPCIPPPLPTWPDPIHRPQKHHLYDPTVRE